MLSLASYNELDFIFSTHKILKNNDNLDNIYGTVRGTSVDLKNNYTEKVAKTTSYVVYKNPKVYGTKNIIEYYKKTSFNSDENENVYYKNQYSKLIRDFSKKEYKSLRLKASDFVYLKKLGVYPINRLWILRRFPEFSYIPYNLLELGESGPSPISTIVGWIEKDENNFLSLSVNETWTTIDKRLDQVILKAINEATGMNSESIIPIPLFATGALFYLLKKMDIVTNFDQYNLPQGNPFVLNVAASRTSGDSADVPFANNTKFSIKLETEYEQKFIGDIDPGSAMLDIIYNCLRMGSSDVDYVLKGSSDIVKKIRTAAVSGNDVGAWIEVVSSIVSAFVYAVTSIASDLMGLFDSFIGEKEKKEKTEPDGGTGKSNDNSDTSKSQELINKFNEQFSSFSGALLSIGGNVAKSVLASTIARWRYALYASIALMTGENSTPYHLTIGNPYSPFISINNITVSEVTIDFSNELAFNDLPVSMKVSITANVGRPLGTNELIRIFNNGYARVYSGDKQKNTPKTDTEQQSNQQSSQQQNPVQDNAQKEQNNNEQNAQQNTEQNTQQNSQQNSQQNTEQNAQQTS